MEKPSFVDAWTEPESAANTDYQPIYPYNNVIAHTKAGHSFEIDDTPTRERIRLQHGTNTFLEMHPNGDEVHKIVRDGYHIVAGDSYIRIGVDDGLLAKKLQIEVYGDVKMHVQGNMVQQVDGNFEQYVKGNYSQIVEGIHTTSSFGNMRINAGSGFLGKLVINTPDHVRINGDLNISGEATADKITSVTRVDAGTGMSAGPLGFVTLTGGLSVGIPAALPLNVVCAGPITSFSSVNAPLGTFGVSASVLAYDVVNQLLRKVHTHIAKGGPTTPPVSGQEVKT
jgi:hypothetical protein